MEYSGVHWSGNASVESALDALAQKKAGIAVLSRISMKFRSAKSPMASPLGLRSRRSRKKANPSFLSEPFTGIQHIGEHPHIFKATVHALAVETDNGMGGIAKEHNALAVVPGLQRVVTNELVGWVAQSASKSGRCSSTSGKCCSK